MRADARRNRDQIVAAAQTLFLEEGIDVAMEEVARRAGVGVGTLYRRFPDRDALLRATAQDSLRRLAEMGEAAREEEPDDWSALCRFLRGCTELRLGAMASAIEPRLHQSIRAAPELTEIRQRVIDVVDRMTAGAQAEGALRTDVGAGDVAMLMTVQVYTPPHLSNGEATRRVVDIMLDGLRPGRALTGSPVRTQDVHP